MPNRKKTVELKELQGTLRATDRKNTPAPAGEIGDAPAHLSTEEKTTWQEIAMAIPPGIAGASDRIAMEIMTKLLVRFRSGETTATETNLLLRTIKKFGLSPLDRDSVSAIQPQKPKTSTWA